MPIDLTMVLCRVSLHMCHPIKNVLFYASSLISLDRCKNGIPDKWFSLTSQKHRGREFHNKPNSEYKMTIAKDFILWSYYSTKVYLSIGCFRSHSRQYCIQLISLLVRTKCFLLHQFGVAYRLSC